MTETETKPILRLKDPKRFLIIKDNRDLQQRIFETFTQWTRSRLIDEVYLCLMSVKEKDEEGITVRKYEEQIRKKMYWMSVLPRNAIIVVSLNDLNEKAKQELLKDDPKSRDFTLKEAIGMICEQVDSRYYLLNAKRFLKVRLEK